MHSLKNTPQVWKCKRPCKAARPPAQILLSQLLIQGLVLVPVLVVVLLIRVQEGLLMQVLGHLSIQEILFRGEQEKEEEKDENW